MSALLKAYQVLPVVPQLVGLVSHLLFLFVLSSLATFIGYQVAIYKNALKKDLPWFEFNRRLFPVGVILHACAFFFPVFTAVYLNRFPHRTAFLSHTMFVFVAMVVSYVGSASMGIFLRRKLGVPGGSLRDYWNSVASDIFLLRPQVFVLGLVAFLLFSATTVVRGYEWLIVFGAMGLTAWMHTGGYIILLKVMSIVVEPSQSLKELVKRTSEKVKVPPPKCFEIPSRLLNAFAWPLGNYVGVTRGAAQKLTSEELETVLFHEFGHLTESRKTKWARVGLSMVPLLLFGVLSWLIQANYPSYVSLIFALVMLVAARIAAVKIFHTAEKEADKKAVHSKEAGVVFAKALEKIYRENFLPAVVNGDRSHYPSLYDRMTSSGVTPSFTRPGAPSRYHALAAMAVVVGFAMLSMLVVNQLLLSRLQRSDITSAGVGFAVGAGVANAKMFNNLGNEKLKSKHYATASILYRAATELERKDPLYPTNLATSLAYEKKCDLAVRSLKRGRTRSDYYLRKFGDRYAEHRKFDERQFVSAATLINEMCYSKTSEIATKRSASTQKVVKAPPPAPAKKLSKQSKSTKQVKAKMPAKRQVASKAAKKENKKTSPAKKTKSQKKKSKQPRQ